MDVNSLQNLINEFEEKAGFAETTTHQLITMIEEETALLKEVQEDTPLANHQLADLLVLLMQVANRYDTNFDEELDKWFEKSKKYV